MLNVNHPKPVLAITIAAGLAVLPAAVFGIPFSRDLYHHFRLAIAFFNSASAGDFYPGWLEDANGTFGELSPRFYPPGLSYLLVAGRVLLGDWYSSAFLVFFILTLISGIGAYFWARSFVRPEHAAWAGVLYIFAPYHLNELYQSSLLAEFAAAAALPFVFGFTERICRGGGRRDVAGLSASYAALVLTHTPLAVIGSYALVPYALLSLMAADRKAIRNTIGRFAAAVGLGLTASACFWGTVAAELQWLRPDIEPGNVFSWRFFLFSTFQHDPNNIWYGNFIALATLAMALPAVAVLRPRSVVAVFAGSLLMSTIVTYPLWHLLPVLKSVQVPWRWLAVSSMAAAVAAAASIPKWKEIGEGRRRPLAIVAVGCVVGSVVFSLSHPVREAQYMSRAQLAVVLENLWLPSIGAWYPRWVAERFRHTPEQVVMEGRRVAVELWQPERRRFYVAAGPAGEARIRTFYYPLWKASTDGKELQIRPADDGAMLVSVPTEATTIDLVFIEPVRSKLLIVLSIAAWAVIAGIGLAAVYERVHKLE
jgi:hypothetical protein